MLGNNPATAVIMVVANSLSIGSKSRGQGKLDQKLYDIPHIKWLHARRMRTDFMDTVEDRAALVLLRGIPSVEFVLHHSFMPRHRRSVDYFLSLNHRWDLATLLDPLSSPSLVFSATSRLENGSERFRWLSRQRGTLLTGINVGSFTSLYITDVDDGRSVNVFFVTKKRHISRCALFSVSPIVTADMDRSSVP